MNSLYPQKIKITTVQTLFTGLTEPTMIIPKQKMYEHLGLVRKHADKKTKNSHVLTVSGEDFDGVPKFQLSGKLVLFLKCISLLVPPEG